MDIFENRLLRGYELRERVGAGGFGVVYHAFQPSVGREVAVKAILPQHADHPDFIRRFEVEAQLVAQLEHPHIVPLYDYWREPSGAFLVMRWLRGSLRQSLDEHGAWGVEATARLLDQVAAALAVAHRRGVIHRDLKPDNILLDEDGNAYVADFSIAKDLSVPSTAAQDAMVGSPLYLTPEQIQGEPVSPQTDIYSLGVVVYEMLAGQKPFPGLTLGAVMMKHLYDPLPPLSALRPELPAALNAVIQKATAKDPSRRYRDALDLASAFRIASETPRYRPDQPLLDPLTRRELDILRLMAGGLDNQEIAEQLVLSPGTVKWYVKQIFSKLDVHSRAQAAERGEELLKVLGDRKASALASREAALDEDYALITELVRPYEAPPPPLPNPYKGLRAFQEADAPDFFGRETLVGQLLRRLVEPNSSARFLAVIGPSGSGKSSAVKAGLIPALRRGALPGSENWFIVEMLPGAYPFEELEAALLRTTVNPPASLLGQLREDDHGLLRAAKRILPGDDSTELVIVIDQFEELFTLVESEEVRTHFLDSLAAAIGDPHSRVRVVVTLRADFTDRPLLYAEFGKLLRRRNELVLPLNPDELKQTIIGPAQRAGVEVDPDLVGELIRTVAAQPGTLPLLEFALTELFEEREGNRLTLEAYRAGGGVLQALAHRADELYTSLTPEGQDAARQVFLRLVTPEEDTENVRRRALQSELTSLVPDPQVTEEVIDAYARYRLLTLDRDPATRGPTVEVAHEALLRGWDRLRAWLHESREDISLQRRLGAAAGEWLAAGRDPSYLASGARLAEFETWAASTGLALAQTERDYLQASLAQRDAEEAADSARRAREAKLEQRARHVLRALVAVFALAAAVAFLQRREALRERDNARSIGLAFAAREAQSRGDPDLALALAVEANRIPNDQSLVLQTLGEMAYVPGTMMVYTGHENGLSALAVSPDGSRLLTGSGRIHPVRPPLEDNTVRLWDVETGEELRRFEGHTDAVLGLVFAPDGRTAYSASLDGSIIHWDLETSIMLNRYPVVEDGLLMALELSPDGRGLLVGGYDNQAEEGLVQLIDPATWSVMQEYIGYPTGIIHAVTFSRDGRLVIAGGGMVWDGVTEDVVMIWDTASGESVRSLNLPNAHPDAVFSLSVSPDGGLLLAGYMGSENDGYLVLWDTTTWEEAGRLEGDYLYQLDAAFSPDGTMVLSSHGLDVSILWDVVTGLEVRRLFGHATGVVRAVAFAPDGSAAFTASEDGTVRRWALSSGLERRRIQVGLGNLWPTMAAMALTPDGRQAVTAVATDSGYPLILWDLETGQEVRRFGGNGRGHDCLAHSAIFTPDGRRLFSASGAWPEGWGGPPGCAEFVIMEWDVESGAEVRRVAEGLPVTAPDNLACSSPPIALSPDGRDIAVALREAAVGVIDLETGELVRQFAHQPVVATSCLGDMVFSPDGRWLMAPMLNETFLVWDWATGELTARVSGLTGGGRGAAFSPDGRAMMIADDGGPLLLWDTERWEVIRRLGLKEAAELDVVFSPDGRLALSGLDTKEDWYLQLWNVETGEPLIRYDPLARYLDAIAFSPDGNRAYFFGEGALCVWDVILRTPEELVAWTLANRYVPELTDEQRALYGIRRNVGRHLLAFLPYVGLVAALASR